MFYIYDTAGNLRNTNVGHYLDQHHLVGLIVNKDADDEFTIGKITDAEGNEASEEALVSSRRNERTLEFSLTLDKVNGWWKDNLTAEQVTAIGTWRQAWLNYPNNLTLTRPIRPTLF